MLKATFFIGDLHLKESHQQTYFAFCRFLDTINGKADALYILGDLFDYWVSNQYISSFYEEVARKICYFSRDTPVYFCHGNRDFLLNYRYAQLGGMHLLPEITVVSLYNKKCLLAHGDQFCIDDKPYQIIRKIRNNDRVRQVFSCLPETIKRYIASRLRQLSQQQNQQKIPALMDVNENMINDLFKTYQLDYIIHGHTHKAAMHKLIADKKRIDVGDWHKKMSYCQLNEQKIELITQLL